ncbi:hypothetical protein O6H91_08G097200 [Diphasiastrum complanatum]|uniref:Uncharacterized protein n=1 Tax=Diphasiastrum complanatum TaxID=34168 RepID=A0ACC2D029_DIPCM|nr:hypothetical protein O6H91_08G097200 [Diphasiastrum complanatum]
MSCRLPETPMFNRRGQFMNTKNCRKSSILKLLLSIPFAISKFELLFSSKKMLVSNLLTLRFSSISENSVMMWQLQLKREEEIPKEAIRDLHYVQSEQAYVVVACPRDMLSNSSFVLSVGNYSAYGLPFTLEELEFESLLNRHLHHLFCFVHVLRFGILHE